MNINLLEDCVTPIPEGTPATYILGYTSSTYPCVVVKVERYKTGDRKALVKTISVRQVSHSGNIVGEPKRFTVKPDGRLVEVGSDGWNSLTIGTAVYTPYMD